MRSNTKSLREVAYPKPLRECGIEELSVHQYTANPSGGVMFARKKEHTEKDAARRMVAKLFSRSRFPKGLAILTMPGLDWRFEKSLLHMREGYQWPTHSGPHRTFFTCVESDRCIYHAAITQMPGLRQGFVTICLPPTEIAERAVRNRWIARFYFCNVDDLMQTQNVPIDAAWLDYTGPLSVKRLRIIAQFYDKNIRSVLVLTALKARWNIETVDAITRAGGYSSWLRAAFNGKVLHDINYQDGASPMAQFAVSRAVLT